MRIKDQTKDGTHASEINACKRVVKVGLETIILEVDKESARVKLRCDILDTRRLFGIASSIIQSMKRATEREIKRMRETFLMKARMEAMA